jgi:hypothetical protein
MPYAWLTHSVGEQVCPVMIHAQLPNDFATVEAAAHNLLRNGTYKLA